MAETAATVPPARVGVVGLGVMGGSIARHLIAAGYEVFGYDVRPEAFGTVPDVSPCRNVASLADRVPLLIASLPSAAALHLLADELTAHRGLVGEVVEASTLSVRDKELARDRLAAAGVVLLDCPISGTGAQMRTGDVVVYASGPKESIERTMPVMERYARAVIPCRQFGDGSRLKLVANLLVAVHNVAAAEALAFARHVGLEPGEALSALTSGAGSSRMLEVRGPKMVERSYDPPTMRVQLFLKDLALIEDLARESAALTPLFDACKGVYERAVREGYAQLDTASVLEPLLGDDRLPGA